MARNLQHVRNAIVDPRTGVPTKSFYDILNGLVVESESSETILETIYQTSDFGSSTSGTDTDLALQDLELKLWSLPNAASELEEALKLFGYKLTVIEAGDTTFTSDGNQVIICNNTATATVTLDTSPFDGQVQHFKRRGERVEFVGTVDGRTDFAIGIPNQSIKLIYTAETADWSVI